MRILHQSLVAIMLIAGAAGPVGAADLPDWLSLDEVAVLLMPGEIWCFEPEEDGSCRFLSISTAFAGAAAQYSVVEKWDENTVLTNHVSGRLTSAGLLCEPESEYLISFEARDLAGVKLDAARMIEIRDEIASYQNPAVPEYCYRYAQDDPKTPRQFIQVQFADGKATGSNMVFAVTSDAENKTRPALRNP